MHKPKKEADRGGKRWESCNAEALLDEFFSQDNLRQLAR